MIPGGVRASRDRWVACPCKGRDPIHEVCGGTGVLPRPRESNVQGDPKYKRVPREVRPKDTPGVDWGAEAWILVRTDEERGPRLLWQKGHQGWASLVDTKHYYEATLEFEPRALVVCGGEKLHEGGRLSERLLRKLSPEIARRFNVDPGFLRERLVEAYKKRETLVLVRS